MNLETLFDMQKVLRDRIGYNEPDRFNKLILALLVELGECSNEWRGFKFWSKYQAPRTHKARGPYMDLEDAEFYNPLLEEYVDGLHFVLEIGLDMHCQNEVFNKDYFEIHDNVTEQFIELFNLISTFWDNPTTGKYLRIVDVYLSLGQMLGFTWEQIEQCYYDKNKINHDRQESGVY